MNITPALPSDCVLGCLLNTQTGALSHPYRNQQEMNDAIAAMRTLQAELGYNAAFLFDFGRYELRRAEQKLPQGVSTRALGQAQFTYEVARSQAQIDAMLATIEFRRQLLAELEAGIAAGDDVERKRQCQA